MDKTKEIGNKYAWQTFAKAGHRKQTMMFKTRIGIKTVSSVQQIIETLSNNYRNENYWSIKRWQGSWVHLDYTAGCRGVQGGREMALILFFSRLQMQGMRVETCWHPYRLAMISKADELYLVLFFWFFFE